MPFLLVDAKLTPNIHQQTQTISKCENKASTALETNQARTIPP